jgi:DNA-directed RNA polymerase subunit F
MSYSFGADNAFDALVYGNTHQNTVDYLRQQANFISDTLTQQGKAFMERTRQAVEYFNSNSFIDMARKVVTEIKGAFETPHVVKLLDVQSMQKASMVMQRWIMANPNVRQMYHKQNLDGYSDTYVDIHGQVSGEQHYDYRRVMDGVMQFNDKQEWFVKEFVESLAEGDRDLTHLEKSDIMMTWDKMDLLLALSKDDPTSSDGSSL